MTNTDDKWGGVGADVLLLLEHFYHTRIDRHGLSSRDDSSSPTFPRAQAILDGELFRRVQEELGLLQTVIVYGLPTDGPSPRYQHLETTLQLVVPWLAVKPGRPEDTTWQLAPLARADAMGKVFRKFREDPEHGVQEFAELLGTAGRGSGNRPGLSPLEQRLNYLLVDDEEMSFFSLVFTLLEARNASSTLDELESWITGSSRLLLRSILRQTDLDGPPGEPGKVRILESPWDDHYWDTATFDAAMAALGFQSPSGATDRFNRMLLWLSEPDGQVALMNPTLCRDGQKVTLADFVREVLISFRRGPEPKPADMPQKFACSLATALDSVTFDEIGVEHLAGSDVLRTSPGPVRFNLPGEYLLRRDESISRTFFATPLSTVNLVEEGTHATAFALGTLLKLDRRDSDLERRLGMLRVLLDAIADFGVSHRIAELAIRAELGRKERERVKWLRHVVFTSLSHLDDSISEAFGPDSVDAAAVKIRQRFNRVFTLCEYVTAKTHEPNPWGNSLKGMLNQLTKWFDAGRRTISVHYRGTDVTYQDNVARALSVVLVNLVDNAHKCAGRDGHITLTADVNPSSGAATVCIENTGSAMNEKFADYLRGVNDVVPTQGARACEGLQTVRHVLVEELRAPFPSVEAPAREDSTGTRVYFVMPAGLTTGDE